MKMRRLLSVLLAIAMVLSILSVGIVATSAAQADTADTAADINIAAAGSAYEDMLAKTTVDNNYGLSKTVNDGTILQAWTWSFKNIESNLETIAEQGFTTIQVSPPNEIKKGTKGAKFLQSDGKNGWWMYYQPSGFQLNNSTDNALGTKAEFVSMCEKAHEMGLKIIVDAVINHMGTKEGDDNNTSTDPMSHVTPKAQTFEPEIYSNKLFHSPWKQMTYIEKDDTYYNSAYDLTRNCTSGLPDLKTEDQRVQNAIYDYMDELISSGADGFRFDAAKHIETPDDHDGLGSDFWTDTLKKVQNKYTDKEVYAYGEILNTCGISRPFTWYTKLMDVTDSGSYWNIKNAVTGEYGGGNATPNYPNSNFTAANTVLWDESHDTYVDGATVGLNATQRGKIWALVAGRAGISSVYLARPSDNTNTNDLYGITLGEARKTSWSNATTKAINQFHNYFIGKSEYCTANSGGTAYIERGDSGAMIVNLGGTTAKNVTLTNHKLAAGTYKDAITGNTFTVTKSQIKGSVGSTGVAVIYENNEAPKPTDPPETYILGDVDQNGEVDIVDATLVLRSVIDEATLTDKQNRAADVDGDGLVTVIDATWIQRYIAHKEVKYDIGKEVEVKPIQPTTPGPIVIPTTPYYPTEPDPSVGGTIVFSNNKGFSTVNIYYWSDDSQPVEWPGVAMTSIGMNEYGEERFTFDLPAGITNYIINDGSQQTVDIPFNGSTGVYMTDQDAEGHYNVEFYDYIPGPTPTPGPDPIPDPDTEGSFLLTDNFGWGSAFVYAWDDDGNELYGAWPGSAQAETTQNEYGETQFRCYIPKGATGVILNNGNGEQTEDIKDFSYDGYWMDGSKNDQGHYKVTGWNSDGSGGTVEPTPDYPVKSTFLLTDNFGWGQAYVYAWDADDNKIYGEWPGSAMAETTQNEYGETQFKCNVPEGAVGVILSNGNGAQTEDITDFTYDGYWMNGSKNDQGHYLVTGWRADGSGSGSDDPTPTPTPTPDPTNRTIIFSNNKRMGSVNIYYWSDDSEPVQWPGVAMTSIGMNEYGEERFTFELPDGMTNYIITDGSTKTVDIPFTGATGVYMTDLNGEGAYEVDFYDIGGGTDPIDPPTPVGDDGIYLVGTFSGWETNAQYKMSDNPGAPGEYMISTTLTEGDGVKVVKVENGTQTWYPDGMDNEYTVDAAHAGSVTVYFNPSGNAEWSAFGGFMYIDNGSTPTPDPDPTQGGGTVTPDVTDRTILFSNNKGFSTVNIYYWSDDSEPVEWPGVPMTYYDTNEMSEQRYSFEMPAGMTYYIINDGTQQTVDVTFTGATGVYMTDKDGSGNYEVAFYDIGGGQIIPDPTPDPTSAPVDPTPVGDDGIYLVGTFSGWATDAQYEMSENPGAAGEYMISTTLSEGDGVKVVKVENGVQTWYPDGTDNEYTVDAAHAGSVTVYFNAAGNAEWSAFGGYIYIDNGSTPTPTPDPTQPVNPDPDPTDRTIIFSNNKGFSTVNIYYWSDDSEPVEWPGVPMTYYDTNEMSEQRFSFEMPEGMTNYIINDGSQQTVDIPFTGATGVYMTDKDDEGHYLVDFYEIDNVTPTPTPEPTEPVDPDTQKSFLLTDNFGWGSAYVYAWDANGNALNGEWPGASQAETVTNDYGETQFKCYVPEGAVGVILNNGNGAQTEDITDFSYAGYWMDGTKNSQGHYVVTGWN